MQAPAPRVSLTNGLAVVTGLAWIMAALAGAGQWVAIEAGFVPLRFSGATDGFLIPAWLTPLTATLAHGDVVHLVLNVIMLVYCGQAVERVLGTVSLAILYLVGAVAAAAAQYLVDPASPVPMIGASGAISAIIAVYALLFSRNDVPAIGPIPSHWVRALWLALAWAAVQWLIGLATAGGTYQIATAAHVGGFMAGLALARPLLAWRYRGA